VTSAVSVVGRGDAEAPRVHFRPAAMEDAPAIAGLLARSVPDCVAEPVHRVIQRRKTFWVAQGPRGDVVATAALEVNDPRSAEIRSVTVSEKFRGSGVGRALVIHVLERARGANVTTVRCVSRTPEFFEALGFHRVGSPPPPRAGTASDQDAGRPRVWLWRPLAAASATPFANEEQLAS
jgi:N-acetylglutamate synthase-like GNAT family acetyltransferase